MFGYTDLIFTEQQVFTETSNRLNGFYNNGPKFIDLFFYLQQSFGEMDDIGTLTGQLQSIAYMHYVQLPYTLKLIYEQIMKGYYLESQILNRHLFETLLHLKFFSKHPEKIKVHIEHNIPIKTMISDLTKKPLYDYYKYLCSYTHGFIMKDIHRTDREANKTYLGNRYDEFFSTGPVNWFCDLVLGLINAYDIIYPKNTVDKNAKNKELREYIVNWCTQGRDSLKIINHRTVRFLDAMADLIF